MIQELIGNKIRTQNEQGEELTMLQWNIKSDNETRLKNQKIFGVKYYIIIIKDIHGGKFTDSNRGSRDEKMIIMGDLNVHHYL